MPRNSYSEVLCNLTSLRDSARQHKMYNVAGKIELRLHKMENKKNGTNKKRK
jgi:hypothetical protein